MRRKSIAILILTILLLGCKRQKEQKEPLSFDSIDYSYYLGYTESIKILSDGEMYIFYYFETDKYYSLKLDKSDLDSLSNMTKMLFNIKIDSVYQAANCDHPISFCLIIKSKQRNLMTSYLGDCNEAEWNSLFRMTKVLSDLSKKAMEQSNSAFIFESRSRLILPPPPPRPK
jgi:hypothetical protein